MQIYNVICTTLYQTQDIMILWTLLSLITSTKEVMFLLDFVCLSVCLFVCLCVSKITRKVMDGSFWNFEGLSGMFISNCPESVPVKNFLNRSTLPLR